MSNYIRKDATVLDIKTKEDTWNWLSKVNVNAQGIGSNGWKPLLIRTNFYSFFQCLEDEANKETGSKICKDSKNELVIENIKNTKKKIESSNAFNFLENSSIWMRLCDNENWNGVVGSESEPVSVKKALDEFEWFEKLGLYEFNSAKEFLEYNVRAQKENHIAEIGGHETHVTPMIYSDETEYRDFFIGEKSGIFFKFLKGEDENRGYQTDDVALRILLVDDKIGKVQGTDTILNCYNRYENYPMIWKCEGDCVSCDLPKSNGKPEPCKLKVIRKLMSGEFILENDKKNEFSRKTYWEDKIRTYSFNEIKICRAWDVVHGKPIELNKDFKKQLDGSLKNDGNYVQIIGVRDIESALVLMSCCKFDIIFLDYLLGYRTDNQNVRAYSPELFEFLSFKFRDKEENNYKKIENCPDVVQMFANGIVAPKTITDVDKMKCLEQFRDEVKLNRGPLDKYWIVPMTSYNSSFIADLQRRNVRLIDHRWNISQGADPINTPWHFLHKINEFVDLQLRSSVFRLDTLLLFLKYTCEDCMQLKSKDGNAVVFYDFQAFMGAEYANFMRRYGNRQILRRDAAISHRKDIYADKSVFATYVWKHFYANPEYRDVIELNRLIRRFLHHASVMHNDGNGQQRLEEAFGQLSFFIDTNKKVRNTIGDFEDLKGLDEKMMSLRVIIDRVTDHSDNKKDKEKNT